ncbi:MAG: hypothetical protein WBL21_06045 [Salinimicrobium sp.]
MTKKSKTKEAEVKAEEVKAPKSDVKVETFTLKQPHNGKQPGEKIKLGPIGRNFYKSKNVI